MSHVPNKSLYPTLLDLYSITLTSKLINQELVENFLDNFLLYKEGIRVKFCPISLKITKIQQTLVYTSGRIFVENR